MPPRLVVPEGHKPDALYQRDSEQNGKHHKQQAQAALLDDDVRRLPQYGASVKNETKMTNQAKKPSTLRACGGNCGCACETSVPPARVVPSVSATLSQIAKSLEAVMTAVYESAPLTPETEAMLTQVRDMLGLVEKQLPATQLPARQRPMFNPPMSARRLKAAVPSDLPIAVQKRFSRLSESDQAKISIMLATGKPMPMQDFGTEASRKDKASLLGNLPSGYETNFRNLPAHAQRVICQRLCPPGRKTKASSEVVQALLTAAHVLESK